MRALDQIVVAPPDPILGLTRAFQNDPRKEKINVGVGLFKDEALRTPLLPSVASAEQWLALEGLNKEYLPIEGLSAYIEAAGALLLGAPCWQKTRERIASFQTPGGTGALHIGAVLIQEELKAPVVLPKPTWPNHRGLFRGAREYLHAECLASLEALPEPSIVVLHACCHNPTGLDPSIEEWRALSGCLLRKGHIPFFDCAYQGFGVGLAEDTAPLRLFIEEGHDMLIAVSHAKNLGLYAERVGALFVVTKTAKTAFAVTSRVKQFIRTTYSSPPAQGARIAARVLSDPKLRPQWEQEVAAMRKRCDAMRALLYDRFPLPSLQKGKGMFGCLGLQVEQVERLAKDYAIYMSSDSRINVCGLTAHNLDYFITSIHEVLS